MLFFVIWWWWGAFLFLVALERSKREKKLKKLSSVCEKSRSFVDGEMKKGSVVSPREEDGVEFVGAAKKLKLPRKLLGDCNAVDKTSVPRKLRSGVLIFFPSFAWEP